MKFLPNVPSPVLYEGVLYIVKDGGILTSLDPATGKILKQARLAGAPGTYYSSPVAADGKIYTTSLEGKASVIRAGGEWEVLAVNDLGGRGAGNAGNRGGPDLHADAGPALLFWEAVMRTAEQPGFRDHWWPAGSWRPTRMPAPP